MKDNIVLRVSNIKKCFKIYRSPWDILKEWLTFGKRSFHKDFWALKDVSFDVHQGEFLGIIGPNGAGKSTILRIITEVLRPTEGTYSIKGRVLSILELTGGTDDNLTGRENVIRSGQMMGFPDGYVQDRIERIKEFSELEEFFEQPLRMYSTGMRTRLSFSMFAFMDTDILILDEVLAVGDIFFKQKCFARLAELIEQNTAIILVTHSMGIIQRYCDRVIVLNEGEKIFDGNSAEGIQQFVQVHGEKRAKSIDKFILEDEGGEVTESLLVQQQPTAVVSMDKWPADEVFRFRSFPKLRGGGRVSLKRMAVLNDSGEPVQTFRQGERLNFYCEFQLKEDVNLLVMNLEIRDRYNLLVHSKNSMQNEAVAPLFVRKGGIILYHQAVNLNLAPENYVLSLECFNLPNQNIDLMKTGLQALMVKGDNRLWRLDRAFAVAILPDYGGQGKSLHGGLCNLPGRSQINVVQTNGGL